MDESLIYADAYHRGAADMRERCAKAAETYPDREIYKPIYDGIAAVIRALPDTDWY